MSREPIRGSSLGARSLSTDVGIDLEARVVTSFDCSNCMSAFTVPFAAEAEIPDAWICSSCGAEATRRGAKAKPSVDETEKVGKTPFEMLLERRSVAELEVILEERLNYLRARRGLDSDGGKTKNTAQSRLVR